MSRGDYGGKYRMAAETSVIVVESPAKAATIERYLGGKYTVLASYGHVRDLVNKRGSVDPEHDFAMVWGPTEHAQKRVDDILKAAKKASALILATDPDREGEAIAWHISELVREKYGTKAPPLQRVVFYEITKNAVTRAMGNPRDVDLLLVDAYLARRALDYLVGYSLSPILWQKLPGSRSAGRVQSVALRLIADREKEIEAFTSQEYWTIDGNFCTSRKENFIARLTIFRGKKLEKFDLSSQVETRHASEVLTEAVPYKVIHVEKKQIRRNPTPPFTTSTLQQEASRKLGFGASRTMRLAQRLYEGVNLYGESVGLITYMRTDSVNLSQEAVQHIRSFIAEEYGAGYLPDQPRVYKTKAKNAQEAHEAIRPTSILRRPEDVAPFLESDQLALYELIWKRSLASQMESAVFDQVSAEIADDSGDNTFRTVGTTLIFNGFLRVYQEGHDEEKDTDETIKLPPLAEGDALDLRSLLPEQHFTQPPPRFTEASLVKRMEELGIGRPSTYAPLMQVLQDRHYVTLEKRQFYPSDRGRIVSAFLENFCKKYVEYDFTAQLEEELDDIAQGDLNWKKVMSDFWHDFHETIVQLKDLPITEAISRVEEALADHLFHDNPSRTCTQCHEGKMELKLSKFGAFLGCNRYPECQHRITLRAGSETPEAATFEPTILGTDPSDQSTLSIRRGPYGFYLQIDGLPTDQPEQVTPRRGRKKKESLTVRRLALPPTLSPQEITMEQALKLKGLPKVIGSLDENELKVSVGRFGPYIQWGNVFASIPKSMDFLSITEEEAIQLVRSKLEKPKSRRRVSATTTSRTTTRRKRGVKTAG